MNSKKDKHSILIPIIIAVVGLGIVFIGLLYILTYGDIASIFRFNGSEDQSTDFFVSDDVHEIRPTEPPAATPIPLEAATPVPQPPVFDSYKPQLTGYDYTNIELDESDISKGNLILVNPDTYYDIPDDITNEMVTILSAKNSSYRVNSSSHKIKAFIMPYLNNMMQAFYDDTGNTVLVKSAYRNYYEQRLEYNTFVDEAGRAAKPGYSEHHTGLALDLSTLVDNEEQPLAFLEANTRWFSANAYKYGFTLRYPENKKAITKVINEPWHYRYVGLPHSYILYLNGWVHEEYIENIKDYTLEKPLAVKYDGVEYEVFYTNSTSIRVPIHATVDISGNNTDGFIVTIYGRYDRMTNVAVE